MLENIIRENNMFKKNEVMSLEEYLERAKNDHMLYANAAERMLAAIGEPKVIDTSQDPRLSRIFLNKTLRIYEPFADFYGLEEVIENLVNYFRSAAKNLMEKKLILYLMGPPGGGKSSLAERLKDLMEKYPIYVLAFETPEGLQISPVFESPLALFQSREQKEYLENNYNIPSYYVPAVISPWSMKRLQEIDGDTTKIKVVKMYPSRIKQVAIIKSDPGDENNQDISSLVGKVDLRKLDRYPQNDPDAYSYSGSLCRGNQGIVEMVEIFKRSLKVLNPLLTATQEGHYTGTEEIGAMPFDGIILAHSNESEWEQFRNNKTNEAFIDRIYIVKVPYCLRYSEEAKIYEKLIRNSDLRNAPCAPHTIELLAKWSVLTRLKEHPNSTLYSKLRVYNGDDVFETDPKAKSIVEYRDHAGPNEGMSGMSTRFAFKVLASTYHFDPYNVEADPVHLFYILENSIINENLTEDLRDKYIQFIKEYLVKEYKDIIGKEIRRAYVESFDEYGQSVFERYVKLAEHWTEKTDYKDPDTGHTYDRDWLNKELEKIEKAAGIANPKDFRFEVVRFVLKKMASEGGKFPDWRSYAKIREVIESKIFSNVKDMLPVISFGKKESKELEKKHHDFIKRMEKMGYTKSMIKRLVDWYLRVEGQS